MTLSYHYTEQLDSQLVKGIDENRPWYMTNLVSTYSNPNYTLLDVGCGTTSKLIKLAPLFHCIVAMEPSSIMLTQAKLHQTSFCNLHLVQGFAEYLPFSDNQFDIVTVMLAPHVTSEIHRVLKPGGYAIVEKIGANDKAELKKYFGEDAQGWRGYLYPDAAAKRTKQYQKEFDQIFSDVQCKDGTWNTYYSYEGLCLMLEQSPTIRNFNREQDISILQHYQQQYFSTKSIAVTQNRVLFIARK